MKIDGVEITPGNRVLIKLRDSRLRRFLRWLTRGRWPAPPQHGVYVAGPAKWSK